MKDLDAILAMEQAEKEGTYVAAFRNFKKNCLEVVELDTVELVDKLLETLFLPTNQQRFRENFDYVAVWQGRTFYAAMLSTGHEFSCKTFMRYLEEMDA